MSNDLAAVVMAGGLGTRMRSATPKHLHPLLGRRVVDWVLEAARELGAEPLVVVTSPDTRDAYDGLAVAVQEKPRGTGDAVAASRRALDGFDGAVLVLDAAAPLLTSELLQELVDTHRREASSATILSFVPDAPLPYGRVLRNESGAVTGIVEEKDATAAQRAVTELNSSVYVFEADALWPALELLDSDNVQGELYLTDTIAHIAAAGGKVVAHRCPDPLAPIGVNDRRELAVAAATLRDRINERHLLAGATIVDPVSTWIDHSVVLEADAVVHPFTVLRGSTSVARGAQVGPHVVAQDAAIGENVSVGPFCYLRPGTVLEADTKAGTFVEIKNSRIGARTKVPHLSYLGDAEVGEDSNVAAGNITANFSHTPGTPKGKTTIGKNVRTGIHNGFEAPVTIGDGAWIAGGSYIRKDVPADSLAGFPPRQRTKEGYVRRKRND
jgi:bifunctional UDP-N-acetylglucosamine pyrophosphorylase / glucosamine-1-phosphate N-acetyltransferase